ncbi:MAG: HAMP domain-containing protein [Ruminococcaceae bacterium]|nr:HAMP domain-containing protein [Oscillospiraceae bacterium]
MKIVSGIKLGGLQQKIFNLMLFFIFVLIGAYVAVSVFQQKNLTRTVQEASAEQQASIAAVSEETMEAVLEATMGKSNALQAYIADDLFNDIQTDVLTLQSIVTQLFEHAELFSTRSVDPPSAKNKGIPSAQLIHESGVHPEDSQMLGLVGNLSDIMLAIYENNSKMSSCFIGTADGNMILVNDRADIFIAADGTPLPLDIRNRPWFVQAANAGELIFTGVEIDAYTENPMLECAAPVYHDGKLVAVVAADIYLTAISDYVESTATDGGYLCVINEKGQVLFSPEQSLCFKAERSADAPDLRQSENAELARFVTESLSSTTGLESITVDGKEYYMTGTPMSSVGWTVISVVDKEITHRPTEAMLARYDEINEDAHNSYAKGAEASAKTLVILTIIILLFAIFGAFTVAGRIVKPLERMTARINSLRDGDTAFEMEDAYRTGDEIEVLAESFATLSKRTRDYITQITQITAEKERIGTELALATRIQADMLPNIYPAFPDRPEFDVYASMDPAKEVGGDFYDFFLIDRDHLGIVMADVSGKGVPAALFMMISKILVQNYAMTGHSPAEVLQAVNDQICANNREEMFVTVWFGILDIKTGRITAANAGHEYPALLYSGGQFELLKDKHGFVIGGMEGMKYKEYEFTLTPGSKLFLYTDGVPEATNAEKELFGTERMLAALNENKAAEPQDVLKQVRRAVDGFVNEAEQFDDLTMLCLEYRGESEGN